jgi:hypothetical protein
MEINHQLHVLDELFAEKSPVLIKLEAGCATEPGRTPCSREAYAPAGIRAPDR